MAALRGIGVSPATIERLHLGLKAPYRSRADGLEIRDALTFPVLAEGLRASGRYAYLNLPGVTSNAPCPTTWGPGAPLVYRLGSFSADATAVVFGDVVDCWLAWQSIGEAPELAFMTRSHAADWPGEWKDPGFWSRFSRIVVMQTPGAAEFLADIAPRCGRQLECAQLPAPFDGMSAYCADRQRPSFDDVLDTAQPWVPPMPRSAAEIPEGALGRFEASPVRIAGAFAGGYCYYPFTTECRQLEGTRGGASRVVQFYSTMVLRSDGSLLTTEMLPAPRGTPLDRRVLALSDGTRLLAEPTAALEGTWSFAGIDRFVGWRSGAGVRPYRQLSELLVDVQAYLSSRVRLPMVDQHLLAAAYIVLSFVYQLFDAVPLLLVCGERGTGKSELGEAIARISFNASVAGQLRAAGMIRLLDETRGLLVLDDMDGEGPASVVGNGDLAQAIKTSYKRSTSRKPIADRGGRVRMADFFGPKVITNTRGVDSVLGSRMVQIVTAAISDQVTDTDVWSDERLDRLRDELHAWAMASAHDLHALASATSGPHRDRRAEICAPLLTVIAMTHDDKMIARLSSVLAHQNAFPKCVDE